MISERNQSPRHLSGLLLALALLVGALDVQAGDIRPGLTYTVASILDIPALDHFHSATSNFYNIPPGLAEIGSYTVNNNRPSIAFLEELRGISEFDLAGLSPVPSAFLTFDTVGFGQFPGINDFPFDGIIHISVFQGNHAENAAHYHAPLINCNNKPVGLGCIGSFSTDVLAIGNVYSFELTDVLNHAINNTWSSLGVRLSTPSADVFEGAWTLTSFRLTTTDETTTSVPEPAALLLLTTALLGLGLSRSRWRIIR